MNVLREFRFGVTRFKVGNPFVPHSQMTKEQINGLKTEGYIGDAPTTPTPDDKKGAKK